MIRYFRDLLEALVLIGTLQKMILERLDKLTNCIDRGDFHVQSRIRVNQNKY